MNRVREMLDVIRQTIRDNIHSVHPQDIGLLTQGADKYLDSLKLKLGELGCLLQKCETHWTNIVETAAKQKLVFAPAAETPESDPSIALKEKFSLRKLPLWGSTEDDNIDFEWPTQELLDRMPLDVKLESLDFKCDGHLDYPSIASVKVNLTHGFASDVFES